MKCPFCESENTKVLDSRAYSEGHSIKRRRECNECKKRFNTYEHVEEARLYVIKKDGSRTEYDKEKVKRGILRATVKREISMETIDGVIYGIERKVLYSFKNEITAKELGEVILEELKKIDVVAYIRFASVYKDFKDIGSFIEIIKEIENR